MSLRALLVDDARLLRAGFRMILSSEPDHDVVGEAADGLQAAQLAATLEARRRLDACPDAGARRSGGDPTSRGPRASAPRADLDDVRPGAYVYAALAAGAGGLLLKDNPEDQLIAATHVVVGGNVLFAPTVKPGG